MQKTKFKPLDYFKICLEANYYVSAALLIALALTPLVGKDGPFHSNAELYGPLGNNLQIRGVYLALMELLIWLYCFIKKNFFTVALLGVFHLLLIGSLQMYSNVNDLPIESDIEPLFLYTGLSHIFFGILYLKERKKI